MSAHDDGQADTTTRGGGLRRLPDPPSLVRAREAAVRRAQGEPEAPPSGGPAGEGRAAAEGESASSASSGGSAADGRSDVAPGPAAARPPGTSALGGRTASGARTAASRAAAGGEADGAARATGGAPAVRTSAPDDRADVAAASPAPGAPAPATPTGPEGATGPGAAAGRQPAAPPVAPGTQAVAGDDAPTAVLPVVGAGEAAGRGDGSDTKRSGGTAGPTGSAPLPPAVPPVPQDPAAPPGPAPHAAGATALPGPPAAPPPYSGGPYAPPPHGHHPPAARHQPQPPQPQPPQPVGPQPQPAGQQPAPYRSVPARVSVPVVRPEMAGAEGKVRHGDTFARRTGRYLKRLLASSSDTAAVVGAVRAVQQPLPSGRQIAVTSIRGGSGKSTVAALLALTFAHHRTDPVLAVEADPALGTLPRRLGATEVRWSCTDLARILDPSMQITDLIGYLLPFHGGGWLLPGSQGTVGTQLDLDTYRVVMTSMRRYFAATVVDCQTLPAEVARTALTTTQARVLVAPATVEGVAATRTVLEWLGKLHRSMLPSTVVALTHTSPDSTLDVRRSTGLLQQDGAHVVTLPYDRHLAGGGTIRWDLLALETQESAARLSGAVMDRAASR